MVSIRHNRATELQLIRCVMELLRELRPTDIMGFSCHVSALAELCFSVHSCYVPYPVSESASVTELKAAPARLGTEDSENGSADDVLVVPLGGVDEKLRAEAGALLLSILSTGEPSAPETVASSRRHQHSSSLVAAEVVYRRFVMDICEQPLAARYAAQACVGADAPSRGGAMGESEETLHRLGELLEQLCGRSNHSVLVNSSSKPQNKAGFSESSPSTKGAGVGISFFSSLGMMMSSSSSQNANSIPPSSSSQTSTINLRKFHKMPTAASKSSSSASGVFAWSSFYSLDIEMRVLLAAMQSLIRLQVEGNNSRSETLSETAFSCLIAAVGCVLSPWLHSELYGAYDVSGKQGSITTATTSMVSASDISDGLLGSLSSILMSKR